MKRLCTHSQRHYSVLCFLLLVPPFHKLLALLVSGMQIQKLCFNICCDPAILKQETLWMSQYIYTDMEIMLSTVKGDCSFLPGRPDPDDHTETI